MYVLITFTDIWLQIDDYIIIHIIKYSDYLIST